MVAAVATMAAEMFGLEPVVHHGLVEHLAKTGRIRKGGTGHAREE